MNSGIQTSMSGTLYLHGKHSLYANPTWLHLIKKLKEKENSVLKIRKTHMFFLFHFKLVHVNIKLKCHRYINSHHSNFYIGVRSLN